MLREQIPGLLTKWQPIVGVEANSCSIKKMKTKWGTCNIEAKRIWLNLELAKKVGLRASRRMEFFNAKIDCRLLKYELYEGTRRKED